MRIAGYILSFYIVLLSVFPCCMLDDCPDDKAATAAVADHSSGDEDDCGTCSPFFSCEGCSFATTTPESLSFNPELAPAKRSYTDGIRFTIPQSHFKFWRPPQLN